MTAGATLTLGIFAKTFGGTSPQEVLSQARTAGYDMVQYNMSCSGLDSLPTSVCAETLETLRLAIGSTGVRIGALSATYNMIHPDRARRQQGRVALATLASVAEALAIPCLTVCTGSRHPTDQWAGHRDNASPAAWDDLIESMNAALTASEAAGTIIAVEPEPGNVVASPRIARRLIDTLRHPRIGVVLDLANLLQQSDLRSPAAQHAQCAAALEAIGDRIVLVHAKDRSDRGDVVAAGQGAIDFAHLFDALRRAGVAVPVVTHGLQPADAAGAATYLRQLI